MVTCGAFAVAGGGRAWALQLSPQQKQERKLHYERATRGYDVGKYQEAIDEYQKAYEIGGDPPMLYNIAQAYRLNDQPVEAIRFYRRYLQRQPNARNREDVERKISDLEKTVEERRKAAVPPPPPPPTPPPVVVAPVVTPPPPPPVVEPVPEPSPVTPPPAEPAVSHKALKIVGWSFVGVAAIAGGAAGYFAQVAKDKADKISSLSTMGLTFEPGVAAVERNGKNANLAAIILAGTSGALLATGAILLIVSRSPSAPDGAAPPSAQASIAPWISVGGGMVGAGAHLRF